jgi:hypothetical protein
MSNNHIQIAQTNSHRPFGNQKPAIIIIEVIIRCLRILSSATRMESTTHFSIQYARGPSALQVCQGLICPTASSRDSSKWSGDLRKELPIPTDKEAVWDQWQRGMFLCLPGNELGSSSWTTAILSSVTWYKNTLIICVILGFRRDVDDSCSLLRYYAAWSGTGP